MDVCLNLLIAALLLIVLLGELGQGCQGKCQDMMQVICMGVRWGKIEKYMTKQLPRGDNC